MDEDALPIARDVEEEVNNELLELHIGEKTGFCYAGEENYLLPRKYIDELETLHNFESRPDDVWIVTFPRSGTTLSQHLIWLIMNNLDYETANSVNVWTRSPFFEFHILVHEETEKEMLARHDGNPEAQALIKEITFPAPERLNNMTTRRLIKTHMPIGLLPKGVKRNNKMIYVARNPKDIIPSYYFLMQLWKFSSYTGSFLTFWKQFKEGHVPWTPFWSHVTEAWNYRNNENILFLFYEDMNKDLPKAIYRICKFLEVDMTEEQVQRLAEHMSIKNFSQNTSVNMEYLRHLGVLRASAPSFIRKGNKRERPEEWSPEVEEEIDEWIRENYENTDMRFPGTE